MRIVTYIYDGALENSRTNVCSELCTKAHSHTPLVAMPSRPLQPGHYCKTKKLYNLQTLKMEKLPKIQGFYIHTNTVYKLNYYKGWPDATQKQLPALRSHDLYPGPGGV